MIVDWKKRLFLQRFKITSMSNSTGLNNFKKQFQENKQLKNITIAVGVVILLAVGYIVYKQFVWGPDNEKSKSSYYKGLNLAAKDSTDAAIAELEGVVKKYDGKVGGEIAEFTLARQYMTKGNFKKALSLLEGVELNDTYGPVYTLGLQGDCQSEMGNLSEAMSLYEEAAKLNENENTSPMYMFKAALVAEELKDFEKATSLYEGIRDNYSTFAQQKAIDKYIARVSNKKVK